MCVPVRSLIKQLWGWLMPKFADLTVTGTGPLGSDTQARSLHRGRLPPAFRHCLTYKSPGFSITGHIQLTLMLRTFTQRHETA